MAALIFDTLEAVKSLRDAGIEAPKAEAIVKTFNRALDDNVATKADLKSIRSALEALEQRIMLRLGRWLFAGFGLLISLQVGLFAILL